MTIDTQNTSETTLANTMAAGHVLLVVLVGLVGGLILNAGDILDTAQRQEAGWQRSFGVTVMEPLARASHVLFLDRPRAALDATLGRPSSEPVPPPSEVNPSSSTTTSTTSVTVPSGPREVTTEDPLRLFIGGDSMVGQFGPMLQNQAEATGLAVATEVVYEFESGMTRPDFIDWPQRMMEVSESQDPEVVVLLFGGNDAQSIQIGDTWHEFGTDEWISEYRRRVGDLMRQIAGEGRDLYWVGMPIVSSDTFRPRVERLNGIYRTEAEKVDGVTFFDSWPLFEGPDGGYAEYLPNADGDVVDMRLNDGVHLTTDGGIRLARAVWDGIASDWNLPTT